MASHIHYDWIYATHKKHSHSSKLQLQACTRARAFCLQQRTRFCPYNMSAHRHYHHAHDERIAHLASMHAPSCRRAHSIEIYLFFNRRDMANKASIYGVMFTHQPALG